MYTRGYTEQKVNKEWTLEQLAIAERFREIIPEARGRKIKFSTAILGSKIIGDSLIKGKIFINLKLLKTYLKEHYTLEIVGTERGTLVVRHAKTKVPLVRSDEGARSRGRKQKNKLPENYHYWAASTRPNDFLNSMEEPQKRKRKRPKQEMQTLITQEDIFTPVVQKNILVETLDIQKPLHSPSSPVQSLSEQLVPQQVIFSRPVLQNNIPKNYSFRLFEHENIEKKKYYTQTQIEPAFPYLSEIYNLWHNKT